MGQEIISVEVTARDGRKVESLEWNLGDFDSSRAGRLVSDVSLLYLANQKKRTANTKSRHEVSLSGRKPWKQKGTGRARAGSFRSPIWVGGGVAHGPKPRDTYYSIPKNLRRRALKDAMCLKVKEGRVSVLDQLKIEKPKTRDVAELLKKLQLQNEKVLLVTEAYDPNVLKSSRNLSNVRTTTVQDLNVVDVLEGGKLLFTRPAFEIVREKCVETPAA